MDVLNLAELLLSPDEKNELHSSMELLEQSDYSAFYEKNQSIIQSILSVSYTHLRAHETY